jgi:hypothetical protein
MNIFITSPDPIKCAEYLDDKRVVKMVLESTQMLCTALNELAGKQVAPYKSTHKNHPCNVWLRKSPSNYFWLYNHATALCEEYTKRYNKKHKCHSILEEQLCPYDGRNICHKYYGQFQSMRTDFPNCARNNLLRVDYSREPDVFLAYQKYLNDRWDTDKRTPTWYKIEK